MNIVGVFCLVIGIATVWLGWLANGSRDKVLGLDQFYGAPVMIGAGVVAVSLLIFLIRWWIS